MAKAITSDKGRGIMMDMLGVPENRIVVAADGEQIDLGGKHFTIADGLSNEDDEAKNGWAVHEARGQPVMPPSPEEGLQNLI